MRQEKITMLIMKSFSNGPIYNKIYTYIYIDSTFLYLKLYKTSHSMKREENANRNKKKIKKPFSLN